MKPEQAILTALDQSILQSSATFFPALEEAECPLIAAQLHLYADRKRWAVVIERLGYHLRQENFLGQLSYFGNSLQGLYLHNGEPSNQHYFFPVDLGEMRRIEQGGWMNPEIGVARIRDQKVPLTHEATTYHERGISPLPQDNQVNPLAQGRLWWEQSFGPLLMATEAEKRNFLPPDLPSLTLVDAFHLQPYRRLQRRSLTQQDMDQQWTQFMQQIEADPSASVAPAPTAFEGTPPSQTELWPMVAQVLAHRQPELYRPTLPANNHWRAWER